MTALESESSSKIKKWEGTDGFLGTLMKGSYRVYVGLLEEIASLRSG